MGRAKGVVRTFAALGKTRQSVQLPERRHRLASTGENLVRIALVADVPDQAIVRRVITIMKRNAQLNAAKIRRQMTTGFRNRIKNKGPELLRQRGQLILSQPP